MTMTKSKKRAARQRRSWRWRWKKKNKMEVPRNKKRTRWQCVTVCSLIKDYGNTDNMVLISMVCPSDFYQRHLLDFPESSIANSHILNTLWWLSIPCLLAWINFCSLHKMWKIREHCNELCSQILDFFYFSSSPLSCPNQCLWAKKFYLQF